MTSKSSSTTAVKNPKTIGVIMDGNRRWAKERGLPLFEGHQAGYQKFKEFVRWAKELGIKNIYAYAFSTENWNRSKEEVGFLMDLLKKMVTTEAEELIKEKVRVKFIGQIEKFSPAIRLGMKALEKATAKFSDTALLICLSYGGRAEILNAVNEINKNKTVQKTISEKDFESHLWSAGYPDPELIIRTSGEIRTSGFMPWQAVYSEWFFTNTYWPAFTKEEFEKILQYFSKREIRRGR